MEGSTRWLWWVAGSVAGWREGRTPGGSVGLNPLFHLLYRQRPWIHLLCQIQCMRFLRNGGYMALWLLIWLVVRLGGASLCGTRDALMPRYRTRYANVTQYFNILLRAKGKHCLQSLRKSRPCLGWSPCLHRTRCQTYTFWDPKLTLLNTYIHFCGKPWRGEYDGSLQSSYHVVYVWQLYVYGLATYLSNQPWPVSWAGCPF
jgi:hypothetical protein